MTADVHNGHGYNGTLTLTDETELASHTRNFVCLLEETARRHPERPALLCDDATLSHGRLHALAGGFARDLAEDGVGPGARVAVVLPNHWTFAVAMLGIWKLGATAVPLSPLLKPEEQEAILADVDPAAIVKRVDPRAGDWETAVECAAPALIGYSSGSTGRPKGAVFSHAALTFADRSWADMMAVTADDVVLSVLPCPIPSASTAPCWRRCSWAPVWCSPGDSRRNPSSERWGNTASPCSWASPPCSGAF